MISMNTGRRMPLLFLLAALLIPAALLLLPACEDKAVTGTGGSEDDRTGRIVSVTDCKDPVETSSSATAVLVPDCFSYHYDGSGALQLTHINAGLNCCPGTIISDIDFKENTITIAEAEGPDAIWCRCMCLYDIEYLFTGIEPGLYTITFDEKYIGDEEPLQAEILLMGETEDMVCVDRYAYPWDAGGGGEDPAGELYNYSGCKTFPVAIDLAETGPDQSCVIYEYDGAGNLFLDHINAAFNCCPDMLYASIVIEPGLITITEEEDLASGGCDCICLFDMHFVIRNLAPGTYTVRFEELYLQSGQPPLEFQMELEGPLAGEYCVYRTGYPWEEPAR